MGVKYLWSVLAPFCDRKPLYELQGKTVAVDLSCWICEAQNIAEYKVQPRMYLRNLYFRTCFLLLMDVNPVFVLEGKAPELKYDTILARNAVQFKGAKPKTDGVTTGKDRTRFHFVLRQCEEMLGYVGLACIRGKGEAESLCAYLNEDGLVDGCISQDSDCFAYGAQVVYRNFSISTQGAQAASGGAVDVYDIRKASRNLGLGRNKIIAMALLTGCDYSDGVHGIGKDSVLKFFETVSDDDVLEKLRSWRESKTMYECFEKQLADKNICTSCGHSGKIQSHTRNGCVPCRTTTGCDPFEYKIERLKMKNEVNMRTKAIKDPNFPNEVLIKEFSDRKDDDVKELDLKWKRPNVVKFVKFTTKFLQWEELYAFEKILPILTRWQCRNPEHKSRGDIVKPVRIKKVRNPKGVSCYEIIWSDSGECFKGLIPDCQILENNVDLEKLWSTIEPQNLVANAYPQLVDDFKQSKIKPKKVSKRVRNRTNMNEIAEKLDNLSISEPEGKKRRRPGVSAVAATMKKSNEVGRPKRIYTTGDIFCPEDLDSSLKQSTMGYCQRPVRSDVDNLNSSFGQKQLNAPKAKTTSNPDDFVKSSSQASEVGKGKHHGNIKIRESRTLLTPTEIVKTNESFDLDVSSFGDENDLDLSGIIDDIVSRKDVKNELKFVADKYMRDFEEGDGDNGRGHSKDPFESTCNADKAEHDAHRQSCFFVSDPGDEDDLFEKTFNNTFKNFEESSGSDTEEYDYPVNDLAGEKERENLRKNSARLDVEGGENVLVISDDEDSFDYDNYVPLSERLKTNRL